MARDTADLSQLEREFELEMDDDPAGDLELAFESDEGELDDSATALEVDQTDAAALALVDSGQRTGHFHRHALPLTLR